MKLSKDVGNTLSEIKLNIINELTEEVFSFLLNKQAISIESKDKFTKYIHSQLVPRDIEQLYSTNIIQHIILEQNQILLNHIADFKELSESERTTFMNEYNTPCYCITEMTGKDYNELSQSDLIKTKLRIGK